MEMKLGDRVADVTLVSKDGNNVVVNIDGKQYNVDLVMAENGSCSILHEGNSYNVELVRQEKGKSYDVSLYNRAFHVDIVDKRAKYLRMKQGDDEPQDERLVAPMPGKVAAVAAREGDHLEAGDVALVLEAMKMQSNYKVNAPCTVRRVLVAEGDNVQTNQVLMEFDLDK